MPRRPFLLALLPLAVAVYALLPDNTDQTNPKKGKSRKGVQIEYLGIEELATPLVIHLDLWNKTKVPLHITEVALEILNIFHIGHLQEPATLVTTPVQQPPVPVGERGDLMLTVDWPDSWLPRPKLLLVHASLLVKFNSGDERARTRVVFMMRGDPQLDFSKVHADEMGGAQVAEFVQTLKGLDGLKSQQVVLLLRRLEEELVRKSAI